MKSTIQQEAEKAAKKIREALEEFNRATDTPEVCSESMAGLSETL